MTIMINLPTFCPECGEIHKSIPQSLSYPSASVSTVGKEIS